MRYRVTSYVGSVKPQSLGEVCESVNLDVGVGSKPADQ